jgi:hypothetical protein
MTASVCSVIAMGEPIVERPAMANYGVPAGVEGALAWAWAKERLVASRNYWVVTANAEGRPHAMPVWGLWLPEDVFWFGCDDAARKARNLRVNPQMVVAADSTVEVVSVEGRARPAVEADVERAIVLYAAKYGPELGDDVDVAAFLRSHGSFVMEPERAFGMIERPDEFAERATRWRWVRAEQ